MKCQLHLKIIFNIGDNSSNENTSNENTSNEK